MRLSAAGSGAGAGTALNRQHVAIAGYALEAGKHIEQSAHVGGLFLHPDNVAGLAVAGEFNGEFFVWKRIELFEKYDGGRVAFSLLTLGLELVADFSGADQDTLRFS